MLRLCLLALALVSASVAEVTLAPADDITMTTAAPPITEFSLDLEHVQSGVSFIKFKWDVAVPDWMKVQSFSVSAAIKDSDSEAVVTYPELEADEYFFEADDLHKDSKWEVCVTTSVLNGTEAVSIEECMESFTIPIIRNDSIIGLIIVFAVIGGLILIGYVSWKCDVYKKEKREAEAAAAAEEEENEGKASIED